MKVDDDVICKLCKRIFCCDICRKKHEMQVHAITVSNAYVMCPICEGRPLLLREIMYPEMLQHIESCHLPLRCHKCDKLYTKIGDFDHFSKCLHSNKHQECSSLNETCDTDASKVTVTKAAATISTQTSPMCKANDVTNVTPISVINLKWKSKTKMTEEIITDSASSIRNISSINNSSIQRSIGLLPMGKDKLVRTTSTPVHAEMFLKPKEQTFNGSGGQVSSIHHIDSDNTPAMMHRSSSTPPKQSMDNFNRYLKVNRAKFATVTPLRQVMSKSIQKALAEHGLPGTMAYNRKKMFDSADSSLMDPSVAHASSPLDLRLSPAVRRTQIRQNDIAKHELNAYSNNQVPRLCCDMLLSSKKLTESIVITRTKRMSASYESTSSGNTETADHSVAKNAAGSVYETCHSVEIITSTELSEMNIKQNACVTDAINLSSLQDMPEENNNIAPSTPLSRIPGAVITKKFIKFEGPKIEPDVFFTPTATPTKKTLKHSCEEECGEIENETHADVIDSMKAYNVRGRFSPQRRPPLRNCAQQKTLSRVEDLTDSCDDEVFLSEEKTTQRSAGGLWSLMTSVIQLGRTQSSDQPAIGYAKGANSIIRRCASIAGSLVRSKPVLDEEQLKTLKRKRTNTMDNQSIYLSPNSTTFDSLSPSADCSLASSKRFRIQGRKPIERMRNNS